MDVTGFHHVCPRCDEQWESESDVSHCHACGHDSDFEGVPEPGEQIDLIGDPDLFDMHVCEACGDETCDLERIEPPMCKACVREIEMADEEVCQEIADEGDDE